MISCIRCNNSGFLNLHQIIETEDWEIVGNSERGDEAILEWIKSHNNHDVQVCDCCGNGETWYGLPGEHYNVEDLPGDDGPYAYNGGLCECH